MKHWHTAKILQSTTAQKRKMTVFWDVVPGSLVEVYQRSEVLGAFIALMMRAASTSEALANF
jgi:hypothetical protein